MSTEMRRSSWLLFLYGLPTQSKTARVNLWRKLKKFGAVQRTSAYILPDEPTHLERFQWLAKQVRDDGGEASVVQTTRIDGLEDAEIVRLFQTGREEDYKTLASDIQATLKRVKRGSPEFAACLEKFQRRFQELKAIDYFDSPKGKSVEATLHRASAHDTRNSKSARKLDAKDFHGKIWLTRPRPEVDRVGSAWLIKKFIDPEARFVFATKPTEHASAIPFDMSDVEFTHQGDACTFETLLRRFAIADKAAKALGEMVHDADLEDGKFGRVECIGLEAMFKGLGKTSLSDEEILAKGFVCFDGLYENLR
jgi:hypothetical protein